MKKFLLILLVISIALMFTGFISCNPSDNNTSDITGDITGDITKPFWVDDLPNSVGTWKQVKATLVYQNDRANIWIYKGSGDPDLGDYAQSFGDYFRDNSWNDISTYVYQITNFFGEAGNRINILFYTPDSLQSWAGYFWSKDFFSDADMQSYGLRSNETNIFYINLEYSVDSPANAKYIKGTLTHEFQHMAQAHYFTDTNGFNYKMDSWANEMCSIIADTVFAGKTRRLEHYRDQGWWYAENPQTMLSWSGATFHNYTVSSLVGTYIMSQLTSTAKQNFIKKWLEKTDDHWKDDTTSMNDLIETLEDPIIGFKGWTGTNYDLNSAVQERWHTLMTGFTREFVTSNSRYRNYLRNIVGFDVPPAILSSAQSVELKAGSWTIAEVFSNALGEDTCTNHGTGANKYLIGFHDGIPNSYDSYYPQLPPNISSCSIHITEPVRIIKIQKEKSKETYYLEDRTDIQPFNLSTNKNTNIEKSTKDITKGEAVYIYVKRP